jgi:hypothetical protein
MPSAAWQELMLRLFIFVAWSCRYFSRSQRSGDIEHRAMLKAAPMALLPMFRSSATNCSLLMKENDPAKRSMPPHPALKDGGAMLASW